MHWRRYLAFMAVLALGVPQVLSGYGVYTHAELIDLAWNDSIRPLLLTTYPGLSEADLALAHAYAYGGSAIQDLGYYPFGKEFFSDLTHYVRSGDFVASLLHNASNPNELAFAIGALSHYIGDTYGHSQAVNPSVALAFPRLASKYGPSVTYEQNPISHGRVEMGFDMTQISKRRFASHTYRERIGFFVARDLLDRAFFETYGLTVRSVLGPQRSAIDSYRYSVRRLIPKFIQVEVLLYGDDVPPESDTEARRKYLQSVAQADYSKSSNNVYRKPGFGTHLLALIVRIIPRIGTLKILSLKPPTAQTEDRYMTSVNDSVGRLRDAITHLKGSPDDTIALANRDLDTGERTKPGAYKLTDKTYAVLLDKITMQNSKAIPPGLREDILLYYSDLNAPISTKKDKDEWAKVIADLNLLKNSPPPQSSSGSHSVPR